MIQHISLEIGPSAIPNLLRNQLPCGEMMTIGMVQLLFFICLLISIKHLNSPNTSNVGFIGFQSLKYGKSRIIRTNGHRS